jgi:NADH:ubiquinone oxidoreductase subunit H
MKHFRGNNPAVAEVVNYCKRKILHHEMQINHYFNTAPFIVFTGSFAAFAAIPYLKLYTADINMAYSLYLLLAFTVIAILMADGHQIYKYSVLVH